MGTVYCDNCGTSLLEETAKFCRACGKPTPLSEAATRRFDEQPVVQSPTSPVGPAFTTPAYMAPLELPPSQQTNDLRQKTRKRNLIIVVTMMAVMIFALVGLLAFLNFESNSEGIPVPPSPPEFSGPAPFLPPQPGVPPVPPLPPLPPAVGVRSTIDPKLVYPGARQTMSIKSEDGKDVLNLHSDDAASTVAAWYEAKLKVAKKISFVGQTILEAENIKVMIFGGDEGAEILITRISGDK
jgi:zinc ribbon protein